MPADESRLVDVRTSGRDQTDQAFDVFGSGLMVDDDLVLTAGHVVLTDPPGTTRVRVGETGPLLEATVEWADVTGVDAALLRVTDPRFEAPRLRPFRLGRFTGRTAGLGVDAVGYPRVLETDDSRARHQIAGRLNQQSGGNGQARIEVDVAPRVLVEQDSPWAGFSGAGVFSGDLLVGIVLADHYDFEHSLLTMLPIDAVLGDPDARRLLAASGYPRSVELDGFFERRGSRPARFSPAQLLRADQAVIPFRGREQLIDELVGWCESDLEFDARLIVGPGGRGKTRLAQQLMNRLDARGPWITGSLRPPRMAPAPASVITSTARRHSVLLVVDYAESRVGQIEEIVDAYENAADRARLRLLMLARANGPWMRDGLAHLQEVLGDDVRIRALQPLHRVSDREEEFRSCAAAFAERLSEGRPHVDWSARAAEATVPDLHDERFGDPLTLQLAALLALLRSEAPEDGELDASTEPGALESRLIAHEKKHWQQMLDSTGLQLESHVRDQAVAAATLVSVRDRDGARALLERVPEVSTPGPVATWLSALYPDSSRYWGSLQPDRLGEHHVGAVTREHVELLRTLLSDASLEEVEDAMVVLGRAMQHQDHLTTQVRQLLRAAPDGFAEAVRRAAGRLSDPRPLTRALEGLGAAGLPFLGQDSYAKPATWDHSSVSGTPWDSSWHELDDDPGKGPGHPLSSQRTGSAHGETCPDVFAGAGQDAAAAEAEVEAEEAVAAGDLGRAVDAYRRALARHRARPEAQADQIRTLLALASVLNDLGDFAESASTLDEALSVMAPGDEDPAMVGRALDLQATVFAEMGQIDRALAAAYEAVRLLAAEDQATPAHDVSGRAYARALSNLAGVLLRAGRSDEARAYSDQALARFAATPLPLGAEAERAAGDATGDDADATTDEADPDRLRGLVTHASVLAATGETPDALEDLQGALHGFESLPHQERWRPDRAAALSTIAPMIFDTKGPEEAIETNEQAVSLYRELADQAPVFRSELARSLTNHAVLWYSHGGADGASHAKAAASEAITVLDTWAASAGGSGDRRQMSALRTQLTGVLDHLTP